MPPFVTWPPYWALITLTIDHISTLICMTESYATSSFYNNSTYNSVSSAIKHLFLRNKRWGWHFEKLFEPSLTEGIAINHVMLYLFYLNKSVSWKGTVIQKPSTLLHTNMKSQSMQKVWYCSAVATFAAAYLPVVSENFQAF